MKHSEHSEQSNRPRNRSRSPDGHPHAPPSPPEPQPRYIDLHYAWGPEHVGVMRLENPVREPLVCKMDLRAAFLSLNSEWVACVKEAYNFTDDDVYVRVVYTGVTFPEDDYSKGEVTTLRFFYGNGALAQTLTHKAGGATYRAFDAPITHAQSMHHIFINPALLLSGFAGLPRKKTSKHG